MSREHDPNCKACLTLARMNVKPPAAPELPEGWTIIRAESPEPLYGFNGWTVPLSVLRDLLATQGLHIVSAKDRAVLEAIGAIPSDDIQLALDLRGGMSGHERRMWLAELARREKP